MNKKPENTLDVDNVAMQIASALGIPRAQVLAAMTLLGEGNTIPFIARYRKEATKGLDEVALRAIEDATEQANALSARKQTVLKTIDEQGALTDELRRQIEACADLRDLEAIYLPFKPKRRTRATTAREQGLQPLADILARQEKLQQRPQELLRQFVDSDKGVPDTKAALVGALDIVAEQWSERAAERNWLVQHTLKEGRVTSSVKRGKKAEAEKYEQYIDRKESLTRLPSHRLLAMLRGESEGILKVGIDLNDQQVLGYLKSQFLNNRSFEFHRELTSCVEDCYKRLLLPAVQSTVLQMQKERADDEAIDVFGKNLHELLMAAPAGPKVTLGIDPGFRTGCKCAVVDATGKFLEHATIYPTPPRSDFTGAGKTLAALLAKHKVQLIAIGNGTASRESDTFVAKLLKQEGLSITKVMVSEAGASIYSASELASAEFPDLDITIRGAISIARRLQDPLAELVKTDPKSIGVGQYQHDVNQTKLRKCLDRVVESCVNRVGVDLNMASAPLLSRVAGIGPKLAENIVQHRDENGQFNSRSQLTKVPKLGKKAFVQAAGFLRIRDGDVPLDNSAVHPESYDVVQQMAKELGTDTKSLVGNATLSQKIAPEKFVSERVGMPTVIDIITELGKPGRDPRSEFRAVQFDESVNCIEDLRAGQVLEGVITNVTHFGAFIDIGVHQDALIHISQLSDSFVSDPGEVVSVGDVVKVKILDVEIDRKRIAATRKF